MQRRASKILTTWITKVSEASLRSEEDSIKALKQWPSIDDLTKEDRIVNNDRAYFQEYDNYVQGKLEHIKRFLWNYAAFVK